MYKPVNRAIYVESEQRPEKTESGIILPAQGIERQPTRGTVKLSNSSLVKAGDKIVFNRCSNVTIPTTQLAGVKDDGLLVVYERDLIGVDNGNDEPFPIAAIEKAANS